MELWAFILLGVGLVFIALEVFFPSLGVLGTIAAGAIITGGVLAFRAEGDIFLTYLALAFVLGILTAKFLPPEESGRSALPVITSPEFEYSPPHCTPSSLVKLLDASTMRASITT